MSDPLFSSLGHLEERKARGAFFTPPDLADFIAAWAIRSPKDRVLEPSCGDAAFLLSAGQRLIDLGCGETKAALRGVEIHAASAAEAASRTANVGAPATVVTGDFFDHEADKSWNVVLGNPPYVRYQGFTGENRRKGQGAALAQGVRLTGLASSWAPFVAHAAGHLTPSGRLGLVLPGELLTTNYAAAIRSFLMSRFRSVRLVMFERRVFPDVSEEVILLLAEGAGPTDHFLVHQVDDLEALSAIDDSAARWKPKRSDEKWSPALLPSGAAESYRKIVGQGAFERLDAWGATQLGAVTGNNSWFTMTTDRASRLRLEASDLVPVSPPGSKHLRGLAFNTATWKEMGTNGSRVWLFRPPGEPNPAAQALIREGEAEGIQNAYKCRVRSPWWRVPISQPGHLLFTYMNHETPRLVTNSARVRHLNSVHAVRLKSGRVRLGSALLPLAALNTLTSLSAELVGRSYGGGILKLEPTEANTLAVPSLATLQSWSVALQSLMPQLEKPLRGGALNDVIRQVDDALLIETLGLRKRDVRALEDARMMMFERRAARK